MRILEHLINLLGLYRNSAMNHYQVNEQLHSVITELAKKENKPESEIHSGLLAAAIAQRVSSQETWLHWQALSPREQEVTALTCLGYTNYEIAAKLGVSHTTIKTHIRNILTKFHIHGKVELRMALQDWDFREWDRIPYN